MAVLPPFLPTPGAPDYWTFASLAYDRSAEFPSNTGYQRVFGNNIQIYDVNGDGHLDIVLLYSHAPKVLDDGVPIRVLLGNGHGEFTDGTATLFGGTVPRADAATGVVIADFNGDHRLDLFLSQTGYDGPPYPGLQNRLILSVGAHDVVDATATNLPQFSDFTHWSAAGDIDGDGDVDIFVDNLARASPGNDLSPYFLINDGTGHFARSDTRLPTNIETGVRGYESALLFDADNDGDQDLFLGEWGQQYTFSGQATGSSVILFNNGQGQFLLDARSELPAPKYDPAVTETLGPLAVDVTGDGYLDLLVLPDIYTGGDHGYLQVLVNRGDGTFADETASRIRGPFPDFSGRYLHVGDLNGDGAQDIFLETGGGVRFLLNDGTGHFFALPADFLYTGNGSFAFVPGDFNEDGRLDFFVRLYVDGAQDPNNISNITEFHWIASWNQPASTQLIGDAGNNAVLGVAAAETLSGLAGDDVIFGAAGADALDGGDGADYLNGGVGADAMSGGAGDDVYNVDSYGDIVTEALGAGTDRIETTLTNIALAANVENLTYLGNAAFVGLGDAGANVIIGGPGNDYVYAYGGNDTAVGGAGIDVFILDAGNDTANGGDGQDYLFGGDGNDTLNGDAGVDVFLGGAGNDVMVGGADGDYFYGEDGNDIGDGGDGNDIFVMGAGNDTANGDAGQDYFYMGDGDDVMNGGAGVDVMLGEAGNDTFNGGLGVDYMFLGPGGVGDNDTVIVDKNASGVAVVYNFEAGGSNDAIRLSGTGWTTFSQVQAAITDFTASGNFCVLTLDADTNIWLIGIQPSQLTSADFVFV